MARKKSAYRRSIWNFDERYTIDKPLLDAELLKRISLVQSVEAAKKQTPPIPITDILKLIEIADNLPEPSKITTDTFKDQLSKVECWGAGIKTVICVLAVLTNGSYPPLDKKIAKAARLKQLINTDEEKAINGISHKTIAKIYVEKILPKWTEELESQSAQQVDEEWGALANNS